jgi:environmental stress-induced protein Ves
MSQPFGIINRGKKELMILREQVKTAEGLEHARARLAAKSYLDYNILTRLCVVSTIMHVVVSNFDLEVRKVSLEELAFCFINFEERRLKSVIHHWLARILFHLVFGSQTIIIELY